MLVSPKLRQRDLPAVKAATSERVTFHVGASSILYTFAICSSCIFDLETNINMYVLVRITTCIITCTAAPHYLVV